MIALGRASRPVSYSLVLVVAVEMFIGLGERGKFSGALGIGQHCLPQNAVHPRLIAFAPLL
jgi:hypothetical protein